LQETIFIDDIDGLSHILWYPLELYGSVAMLLNL